MAMVRASRVKQGRTWLSIKAKKDLLEELEQGELSRKELASKYDISLRTVRRIMISQDAIRENSNEDSKRYGAPKAKRKRPREPKSQQLNGNGNDNVVGGVGVGGGNGSSNGAENETVDDTTPTKRRDVENGEANQDEEGAALSYARACENAVKQAEAIDFQAAVTAAGDGDPTTSQTMPPEKTIAILKAAFDPLRVCVATLADSVPPEVHQQVAQLTSLL